MTLNDIPDLDRARQAFFGDTATELDTLTDAAANGVTAATLIAGASAGAGGTGVTAAVTVGDTSASVQTANHTALAAAVTAAIAAGHNTVSLPPGDTSFNSTLALTAPIRFLGSSLGPKPDGYTQTNLCYTGTGEAIVLGTDNGAAPDTAPAYDGVGEGVELNHVSLSYTGSGTSSLSNGAGTYGTGTYGVRDWRGGKLKLIEASINAFEWGFWGELSDENIHIGGKIKRCENGVYVGTRSDQYRMYGVEFYLCDRAIDIEGASNVLLSGVNVVDCGSGSICPIKIDSINTRQSVGVVLDSCWLESLAGATSDAFIEVGTSGSVAAIDVTIRTPYCNTHVSPGIRCKSLLKINKALRVAIEFPGGPFDTFDNLVTIVGNNSPDVTIWTHGTHQYTVDVTGVTGGTPQIRRLIRNLSGGHTFSGDITLARDVDGTRRYKTYLTGTETGSGNAGGDWQMDSYSDGGSVIATVMKVTRSTSAVTFPGTVAVNSLSTADATNLGIPMTFDPRVTSGSAAALTANQCTYHRAERGTAAITAEAFRVGNSSGNMDVGIMRSNGSGGGAARPAARAVSAGATAVPAIGAGSIAVSSTSVTAGSDWFALACDNGTATFTRAVAIGSSETGGMAYVQSSAYPIPNPAASLSGQASICWMKGS